MRVLVVEDDCHVARQVETTLTKAGYAVDLAHDGEEARSFSIWAFPSSTV
jgi:two-component system OmpR family response regulator